MKKKRKRSENEKKDEKTLEMEFNSLIDAVESETKESTHIILLKNIIERVLETKDGILFDDLRVIFRNHNKFHKSQKSKWERKLPGTWGLETGGTIIINDDCKSGKFESIGEDYDLCSDSLDLESSLHDDFLEFSFSTYFFKEYYNGTLTISFEDNNETSLEISGDVSVDSGVGVHDDEIGFSYTARKV